MTDPANRQEVTGDDRLWGLLSYILVILFGVIILFMEDKKNRAFLRYHAIQSIGLGVVEFVILTILGIIPVVNCLTPFVALASLGVNIYFAIKANNGEYFSIPYLTDFLQKQNWL